MSLHLLIGPMFAGKSTEMMRLALNHKIIGKKILEEVRINKNLIVRKGEEISEETLARLYKLKLTTIMVRSKEVGEIIFLNKKYKKQ